MKTNQKKYAAIAVVAILAIAAIGVAWYVTKDDGKESVTFLIQDDKGVYFWASGSTNGSVLDALDDAASAFKFPFEKSTSTSGDGIQSLFGIEMKQNGASWSWWSQYYWDGDSWETAELMPSNIKASEYDYFALVYEDGSKAPAANPDKAVPITSKMSGFKFIVESESGLYFYISGTGDNAALAMKAASAKYNVPYVAAETGWIETIFGIGTVEISEGKWTYWSQFTYTDGKWIANETSLAEITDSSKYIAISYGDGIDVPPTPM